MTFEGVGDLMYAYAADKAEDVPSIVEGFYGAGRLNHGDIDFVIPDETVVANGHQQPLPALASILDAYTSGVVKVRAMLLAKVALPEAARLVVLLMVQKVAVLNLYLLKSKGIELI